MILEEYAHKDNQTNLDTKKKKKKEKKWELSIILELPTL